MTATVTLLPRLPRGIAWTASIEAVRNTAMLEINEHITEAEADRRIARHARAELTADERDQAYEDLKDRLRYLSWLHSDDFDPMQYEPQARDRERLIDDTEHDIEHHLRRIVGRHPALDRNTPGGAA